jgi:hypothetical protein
LCTLKYAMPNIFPILFSVCLEHAATLGAEEFCSLASCCLLSAAGLAAVPRVARPRILKKALKHVEIRRAEKAPGSWDVTERWLHKVRQHFDKFKSPLTTGLLAGLSDSDQLFVDRLEQSGGEGTRVLHLLISMMNAGCGPDLLRKLIIIWRQDAEAVSAGLLQVFDTCIQALHHQVVSPPSDSELSVEDCCSCLKLLVQNFKDDLRPAGRIRTELTGLCTLAAVPVADRLDFIQLVKGMEAGGKSQEMQQSSDQEEMAKEDETTDFDVSFLAELYELQQALDAFMPGLVSVRDADLSSRDSKADLLERILKQATSLTQLEQLASFYVDRFSADLGGETQFLLSLLNKCKGLKEDHLFSVEDAVTRIAVCQRDQLVDDGSAPGGSLQKFLEECWQEERLQLFIRIVLEMRLRSYYDRALQVCLFLEIKCHNFGLHTGTYLNFLEIYLDYQLFFICLELIPVRIRFGMSLMPILIRQNDADPTYPEPDPQRCNYYETVHRVITCSNSSVPFLRPAFDRD